MVHPVKLYFAIEAVGMSAARRELLLSIRVPVEQVVEPLRTDAQPDANRYLNV
jgi:hypothetical protein